jgi:hypothetical protein
MQPEFIQQFVGKVCTIFTHSFNRDFKQENPNTYPEQVFHYFMGLVLGIDEHGVLIEQVATSEHLRSYFFFHSIIGIAQEQVLDPNIKEHALEIDQLKTANEEIRRQTTESLNPSNSIVLSKSKFVNPQEMANLSEEMKKKFGD